jgi:DNA (cytosine-5)-methyltransferase 1
LVNVLDLFSGIGGFSLGLERAEMRTVAFSEIERLPRAVLRKQWPAIVQIIGEAIMLAEAAT